MSGKRKVEELTDEFEKPMDAPVEIDVGDLWEALRGELIQARQERGLTQRDLEKLSGVKQPVIARMETGKTIPNLDTVIKLLVPLGLTLNIVDLPSDAGSKENDAEGEETGQIPEQEHRQSFETFKSNVCHRVKDLGDLDFIIHTLEKDEIRTFYRKQWYREAFYLLGMVDYLSNENNIPECASYEDIRSHKLSEVVYPSGISIQAAVLKDEKIKERAHNSAIPEFMRFNIVENEVRNVV